MYKMKPTERITKTVHVSDPDCWYGRDTVEVSLFVGIPFNDRQDVILIVNSIDDFAMSWRCKCKPHDDFRINYMYDVMKKFMFDTMPDTISVKWLTDRGFEME